MMCTVVLHGGICHRTSTPHKSGNKVKEKKYRLLSILVHGRLVKGCQISHQSVMHIYTETNSFVFISHTIASIREGSEIISNRCNSLFLEVLLWFCSWANDIHSLH